MKIWRISFMAMKKHPNKNTGLIFILIAACMAAAVCSLCLGPVKLAPGDVVSALSRWDSASVAGRIVLYSRLPRTLGCILAGAALASSGAIIQTVLQNPLAAPNIIGVNAGAGFAVTVCGIIAPASACFLSLSAFAGAMAGAMIVILIGKKMGTSRLTLVLSGIAVSAVFTGAIELLLTLAPDALGAYADFRVGGFSGITIQRIVPAVFFIFPALFAAMGLSKHMSVLSLGDETAMSLGVRPGLIRIVLIICAAALSGAAVSMAGLLGFVGLLVPHAARRYAAGDSLRLLVYCALGGAALVTVCDLLARLVAAPYDLPVGVILSFLGGPFFLYIILKRTGGRHHA